MKTKSVRKGRKPLDRITVNKHLQIIKNNNEKHEADMEAAYQINKQTKIELEEEQARFAKSKEFWRSQEINMLDRISNLDRRLVLSEGREANFIKVIERLGEDIGENQADYERLRRNMIIPNYIQSATVMPEYKGEAIFKLVDEDLNKGMKDITKSILNHRFEDTKHKIGFK